MDPPGETDAFFTEETARLPGCWCCYDPITELPAVAELPALTTGHVTFGSLNNFAKLNEETLQRWAWLLHAVPRSRLLLLCPEGGHRARLQSFFREREIAPDRLELVPSRPRHEYLQTYHRIDIALDPFPYSGITTTCDALWMGVPVLTLPGRTPASRAGLSLLTTAGFPEFISRSESEYMANVVSWASDLPRLAQLRSTLRERVKSSPLSDAANFARDMEAAYRNRWQRWCASV